MLEIFIITYNRAEQLNCTINAIAASGLNKFKITVLDNCSTDETSKVLEAAVVQSKCQIKWVRHSINIGAAANILRAYEMCREEYLWLICDDDVYDFENVSSTVDLIQRHRPDVALVGSPLGECSKLFFNKYAGRFIDKNEFDLCEAGYLLTFTPAAIVSRQSLFESDFRTAYDLIHTAFPQMFWIRNIFDNGWRVLVAEKIHIGRPPVYHGLKSDFVHTNAYIQSCGCIKSGCSKRIMIKRLIGSTVTDYAMFFSKKIITDKARMVFDLVDILKHIRMIELRYQVVALIVLPFALIIPEFVASRVYRFKKRLL